MSTICVEAEAIFTQDNQIFTAMNNAVNFIERVTGFFVGPQLDRDIRRDLDKLIDSRIGRTDTRPVLLGEVYSLVFNRVRNPLISWVESRGEGITFVFRTEDRDGTEFNCYEITIIPAPLEEPDEIPEPDEPQPLPENPFPDPTASLPPPRREREERPRNPFDPFPIGGGQPPRMPPTTGEPPSQTPPPRLPRIPNPPEFPRGPSPVVIIDIGDGDEDEQEETQDDEEEGVDDDANGVDEEETQDGLSEEALNILRQIRQEIINNRESNKEITLDTAGAIISSIRGTNEETLDAIGVQTNAVTEAVNESNQRVTEAIDIQTEAIVEELRLFGRPIRMEPTIPGTDEFVDTLTLGLWDNVFKFVVDSLNSLDSTLGQLETWLNELGQGLEEELKSDSEKLREKLGVIQERAEEKLNEAFDIDLDQFAFDLCQWIEFFKKMLEKCSDIRRER